mmetsp:Transcript_21310/g.70415  ORF Transcript_21310/g.70415 Transcript_21310/m.70415 type:complete len:306 (+) Transcript_21310:465-1382(+)
MRSKWVADECAGSSAAASPTAHSYNFAQHRSPSPRSRIEAARSSTRLACLSESVTYAFGPARAAACSPATPVPAPSSHTCVSAPPLRRCAHPPRVAMWAASTRAPFQAMPPRRCAVAGGVWRAAEAGGAWASPPVGSSSSGAAAIVASVRTTGGSSRLLHTVRSSELYDHVCSRTARRSSKRSESSAWKARLAEAPQSGGDPSCTATRSSLSPTYTTVRPPARRYDATHSASHTGGGGAREAPPARHKCGLSAESALFGQTSSSARRLARSPPCSKTERPSPRRTLQYTSEKKGLLKREEGGCES